MHDEAVQLKILQTALTLMQSTTLAQNEVSWHAMPHQHCLLSPMQGAPGVQCALHAVLTTKSLCDAIIILQPLHLMYSSCHAECVIQHGLASPVNSCMGGHRSSV